MHFEYYDMDDSGFPHEHVADTGSVAPSGAGDTSPRAFHTLLADIAEILGAAIERPAIASNVADVAAHYWQACACSAYLYNEDDEVAEFLHTGLSPRLAAEIEKLGHTQWISHFLGVDGRPAVIEAAPGDDPPSPFHKALQVDGVRTVASLPLEYRDRRLGVVLLYWREPVYLYQQDIADMRALASLTALALANARMAETRKWERAAQDEFMGMLSHELRTPLTSIMGFTQIMRRRMSIVREIDNKMREQLDLLWAQSQRLNRLLDTFVDITSIERGDFALARQPLDITAVLRTAIEQAQGQAHRGQRLKVHIPGGPVYLHGDEKRLAHMFGHLLSNAFRYSPGDQPVAVKCQALPDSGEVVISITDRGPGIPAETRSEIFKRFYPSDTRKSGGLGVGLFVSRAIAEAHGGRLAIDSSRGEGTTVTVWLPVS